MLYLQAKTGYNMSNKTTTSILEYAEVHRDFSMDDLFAYLHEKVGISKSSLVMVSVQARE